MVGNITSGKIVLSHSAGGFHAVGDAVDRQSDQLQKLGMVGRRNLFTGAGLKTVELLHAAYLQDVQRVHVRVAQEDGVAQDRLVLQQGVAAGDRQDAAGRLVVFRLDLAEDFFSDGSRLDQVGRGWSL